MGQERDLIRSDVTSSRRDEGLAGLLQVAIKNSIDVFYFSATVPMHMVFMEDGEMDKKDFLASWKEIPTTNEVQYVITDVQHSAGKSPTAGIEDQCMYNAHCW